MVENLKTDKNIPKQLAAAFEKEQVKVIHDYSIVSEKLILINTDNGTYKYTDTLYRQTKPHSGKWRRCDDGTIDNGLY